MKRLSCWILAVLFLAVPGLFVLAQPAEEPALLAFADTPSGPIYAVTDGGETRIVTETGDVSTVFPASIAFFRGDLAVLLGETEGNVSLETFSLPSLSSSGPFGVLRGEEGNFSLGSMLCWEADRFGRVYAVPREDPTQLLVFDEAGTQLEGRTFPESINRIEVFGDRLYLIFFDRAESLDLTEDGFGESDSFEFKSDRPPYRFLSDTVYINELGYLCEVGREEPFFDTGIPPAGRYLVALADDVFYWYGERNTVFRQALDAEQAEFCTVPERPLALGENGALFYIDGEYLFTPYSDFTPAPTATPEPTSIPTPTAVPTDTPKPTNTPKPTSTPKPSSSAKPTNTPKPSASPSPSNSPAPTPGPGRENLEFTGEFLYAPVDMSVAELRTALLPEDAEIYFDSGKTASGDLRTGMAVLLEEETYTVVVPGDINATGTVNTLDMRLAMRYLLGEDDLSPAAFAALDLTRDGEANTGDLVLLARAIG